MKSTPSHRMPSRMPSTPLCGISSKPSAQGSENHLAAINTALSDVALNDIDLTSYYVVVRGEKPGVYSNRLVSVVFLTFFLIFEISTSAHTALGCNQHSLCYFVTSKEAADAKYVEKSMGGKVEYL